MSGFPPLPADARDPPPAFFPDPAVDTLLRMLLDLAEAQWVTRHRLARLEHWAATAVTSAATPPEAHRLPAEVEARLSEEREAFVARLMAPLHRA
ncbi:MAG: hypothetical protein SNJ79_13585 [Sphingomonadaceae bacterium]